MGQMPLGLSACTNSAVGILTTAESAATVRPQFETMSNSFADHRVIIFGASGGIGSSLARQLVACGCPLVLVAHDRQSLIPPP